MNIGLIYKQIKKMTYNNYNKSCKFVKPGLQIKKGPMATLR